ncbi:SRA stem-loop-interacting RNA-binding protein [Dirofilaria immitis]
MATGFVRKTGTALKTFKVVRNGAELFVKKISWVTGASELKDHFSQFGKVTNITLPFDLRTGLHKGFAFISFENNNFYQNIRKFKGKHIIDDEEIICSLANKLTQFDCGRNSEIDFPKPNPDNEVETVASIGIEKARENKIKSETNPEIISKNDMDFQNRKVRTVETNLLLKLQKADVSKQRSRKISHLEKAVVSAKIRNLVRESKSDSGTDKKAYVEVRPLRMNVARNGFSGWISSAKRNFEVLTTENTKQKCLENESNSDRI